MTSRPSTSAGCAASACSPTPAHRALLAGHDLGVPVLGDAAEAGTGDPAAAPAHYRHHADDPVAITHSSGTTRMPKPRWCTRTAACSPRSAASGSPCRSAQGTERILSALPAAHAAGIIAVNQALCNRHELLFLSAQGGPARSGVARTPSSGGGPTGVFGFAVTWAELARFDLTARDLDSVRLWFNTGDCAHEAHVRRLVAVGSHARRHPRGRGAGVPGSRFIDGLGSTEMGHSVFHITHRPDTDRYGRCVGKPLPFAEVALLDPTTATEVPVGEVGQVGIEVADAGASATGTTRSPPTAPGCAATT